MFRKNNTSFQCINCKAQVPIHPTSSRDHCTNCLISLHVDRDPGDRLNKCKGVLLPIGIHKKNNKEQIIYKCKKCNETIKNVSAIDDKRDSIIALYKNY